MPKIKGWDRISPQSIAGLWYYVWCNNVSYTIIGVKKYYDKWIVKLFRRGGRGREDIKYFDSKTTAYKYTVEWMKHHPNG